MYKVFIDALESLSYAYEVYAIAHAKEASKEGASARVVDDSGRVVFEA